jgi:hypothetical protein
MQFVCRLGVWEENVGRTVLYSEWREFTSKYLSDDLTLEAYWVTLFGRTATGQARDDAMAKGEYAEFRVYVNEKSRVGKKARQL